MVCRYGRIHVVCCLGTDPRKQRKVVVSIDFERCLCYPTGSMISKAISKEDLRNTIERKLKNEQALTIAATALMNGDVVWNDTIGYSELYRIKIRRTKSLGVTLI